MIKSLAIKNLQSHKDSMLVFNPGVNVIIGGTDSGKSAIVRAFRVVIDNRPSGDEFISNWGGQMELALTTDDGTTITRMKDKSYNAYLLMDQDIKEFVAFKTDVPEEIRKALNIGEINMQRQFAGPFLLAEETSPGEVAKHFNKVAKLDKIDEGVKNINSEIRKIEQNIKAYEMNIESSEKKLEDYDHLEKFEIEVDALEVLEKQYNTILRNQGSLLALLDDLVDVGKEIEEASEIMEAEDLVTTTLDLIYKRDGLEDGPIASINEILDEIEGTENNIAASKDTLVELEEQFEKEFPDICPLCGTNLKK
jgi:exonuclease SbcC